MWYLKKRDQSKNYLRFMNFSYPTQTTHLDISGLPVIITYITDVDQLLEELLAKGDDHEDVQDQRIPYWADLWHAAIALGRYLMEKEVITPGLQTLEIGCGLGLPGIVAAKLGAAVTLSDYLPEPLAFLERNWAANLPPDQPLQTLQMDWRTPDLDWSPELLLASDVAYEKRFFPALEHAFSQLMTTGGRIILTEPNRAIAVDFLNHLKQHPRYMVSATRMEIHWDNIVKPVNILDMEVTG